MELIKLLDRRPPTLTSKESKRYGLYECPVCSGYFECIVYNVNNGITTKCRVCADSLASKAKAEKAASTFEEQSRKTHGDLYSYNLVNYVNSGVLVEIICRVHGVFQQTPDSHKRGHGCPMCADTSIIASSTFVDDASELHNSIYDYSLVEYTTNLIKVKIICKEHGIFWQSPSHHRSGRGCPSCAITGFKLDKAAILYYLRVDYLGVTAYKIGITNNTVSARFISRDLTKITILKEWYYQIGSDAYTKEQEIIKIYKEFRYLGEPLLASGNTELFHKNILNIEEVL